MKLTLHMTINLNGQTIGSFLSDPNYQTYTEYYYQYHRTSKTNGFICGKTTMASSFALCLNPPLIYQQSMVKPIDHVIDLNETDFYSFIMDSKASLNWKDNRLHDYDSGYDQARIVVLTSEAANINQLEIYRQNNIPYLVCGKDKVDVSIAMEKIRQSIGCTNLLVEGGPTINAAFFNNDLIDTISLVVLPDTTNESNDSLSSFTSHSSQYKLKQVKKIAPDGLHLIYQRKR